MVGAELSTLLAQGGLVTFVTVVLLSLLFTWIVLKILHPILAVVVFFAVFGLLYQTIYVQKNPILGDLVTVLYQIGTFVVIVLGGYLVALLKGAVAGHSS